MAANILVFAIGVICYITTSNAVPVESNGVVTRDKPTAIETPRIMSCINEVSGIGYQPAASCKNGRGMKGCCIERLYCDFNTSNIDLTLYGPRGYRDPCDPKYLCCPLEYALPLFVEDDSPQVEPKIDDDKYEDDDDDNK